MQALVVSDFYPNPRAPYEGTFVHRRTKQLRMNGCEVTVFTTKTLSPATIARRPRDVIDFLRTPRYFRYQWDDVTVEGARVFLPIPGHTTSRSQPWFLYRAIRPRLDALRRERPYDLIYLCNTGPLGAAIRRYGGERQAPYVASAIGSNVNESYQGPDSYMRRRERDILVGSSLVVCVSKDMEIKVTQLTEGRARTLTFYSGVDVERLRPDAQARAEYRARLGIGDAETVIVFVGHLQRAKGVFELLNVFSRLLQTGRGLRLILVGDGAEKARVERRIRELGVAERVIATGGVRHEEVGGYLNAADVLALPSWSEGLPNVVMEAGACGLAVVATRVGGVPEAVDDGLTGLLIPPRDENALYGGLWRMIESPDLRRGLGAAARVKMIEQFNYHRNGGRLVEALKRAIENPEEAAKEGGR